MTLLKKLKYFFSRNETPTNVRIQYEAITLLLEEINNDQKQTIEIAGKILKMRHRVEMPPSLEGLIEEQINLAKQNKKSAEKMIDFVRVNNEFINAVYHDIGTIKRGVLADQVEKNRRKDDGGN